MNNNDDIPRLDTVERIELDIDFKNFKKGKQRKFLFFLLFLLILLAEIYIRKKSVFLMGIIVHLIFGFSQ